VLWFFCCCVLCFKTTDSLISANAKVCTYKCNCIMISNTFNFLTLKNRPIRWRTLYKYLQSIRKVLWFAVDGMSNHLVTLIFKYGGPCISIYNQFGRYYDSLLTVCQIIWSH